MRAARVSPQRQYELIMECRSSGMTDSQWCLQHGIKPGTFITGLADCVKVPVSTFLNLPVEWKLFHLPSRKLLN